MPHSSTSPMPKAPAAKSPRCRSTQPPTPLTPTRSRYSHDPATPHLPTSSSLSSPVRPAKRTSPKKDSPNHDPSPKHHHGQDRLPLRPRVANTPRRESDCGARLSAVHARVLRGNL